MWVPVNSLLARVSVSTAGLLPVCLFLNSIELLFCLWWPATHWLSRLASMLQLSDTFPSSHWLLFWLRYSVQQETLAFFHRSFSPVDGSSNLDSPFVCLHALISFRDFIARKPQLEIVGNMENVRRSTATGSPNNFWQLTGVQPIQLTLAAAV